VVEEKEKIVIKTFQDLQVWQKAHTLTLDIYQITKQYPKEEIYCLTSQMRRASLSVTANIVEGQKRNSTDDFVRFLVMSDTSLEELKYYILLSKDLKYIKEENHQELIELATEVGRMLNGLKRSLRERRGKVV
jgi:four helix bundle protein